MATVKVNSFDASSGHLDLTFTADSGLTWTETLARLPLDTVADLEAAVLAYARAYVVGHIAAQPKTIAAQVQAAVGSTANVGAF